MVSFLHSVEKIYDKQLLYWPQWVLQFVFVPFIPPQPLSQAIRLLSQAVRLLSQAVQLFSRAIKLLSQALQLLSQAVRLLSQALFRQIFPFPPQPLFKLYLIYHLLFVHHA